tara:strand:- start:613 stop:765 length:153 start_codon:yes stop_codon:yes gene_type:complete
MQHQTLLTVFSWWLPYLYISIPITGAIEKAVVQAGNPSHFNELEEVEQKK